MNIKLNVELLKSRVPNLTVAAAVAGLRPATVSNLCTGKIPLARAEVKTLVALADLAQCSVDELIVRGDVPEMLETGIKVIDLFAPLTQGGMIGFVARPGMGQLVVLAEILHRMNKSDWETFFVQPGVEAVGVEDILGEVKHLCQSTDDAFEKILPLSKQKIMLAADRQTVLTGEIYTLIEKLQENDINVTTLLVDLSGEAVDETEPYGPLETLWQFDADLASRSVFPAINPLYSTSVLIEGTHLPKNHTQTLLEAKKLLRRYRELRFLGIDRIPASEKEIFHRGQRLEAYFSQPFFVAEPFTKQQGVSVDLQTTISDVQRILKGEFDQAEVDALSYIGKL